MKSRRRLALVLAVLAALAITGSAASLATTSTKKKPGKLVVVGSGGSYYRALQTAYLTPFSRATGIKVQLVEGGDDPVAQVQAQVKAHHVLWDVVVCSPNTELTFPTLWQPINRKIVKVPKDAVAGAVTARRALNDFEAFPVMVYRKDKFSSAPQGWADFYNTTKFPGPRGLPDLGLDSAWMMPATALLSAGVPPSTLVPFDLDRAYQILNALKPNVKAYYQGFTAAQDLIRSGQITMAMMTDGRGLQLIDSGQPVGVAWNQGFAYRASLCTPNGSPNAGNAMKLYNYILNHPAQQAVFSSITLYGPPTSRGAAIAAQNGLKDLSTRHAKQLIPDSPALLNYIRTNSDELLNRWTKFLQS